MKVELLNGANLAYIGDAYYELMVRKHLLEKGYTKNHELKRLSIELVSAKAHEKIYNIIKDELTEEENQIFHRGRNNAPSGYRKNVDKGSYVISTGIEAVIGYLYLKGDQERLDYLINLMIEKGEEK